MKTVEKLHLCPKCGEEKPITQMAQHKASKSGHRGLCKLCRSKRRHANNEYMRQRAYKYKLRSDADYCGVTGDDLVKIAEVQKECAYCGNTHNLTFDHIYPLRKGKYSRNIPANIVVCCKVCNTSKGKKSLIEFYDGSEAFNEERLHAVIKDFFGRLVRHDITDAEVLAVIAGMRAEVEEEKERAACE